MPDPRAPDDDFDPRGEEHLDEVATTEDLAREAEEAGVPRSDEAPGDDG